MRGRLVCSIAATGLALACGGEAGNSGAVESGSLTLVPAVANVAVGDTVRFSATARTIGGSRVAVGPSYAATGGTITTAGIYTAGRLPGIYRVIAGRRGGRPVDTSVVMVSRTGARRVSSSFPLTENPISEGGRWIGGGSAGLDWTDVSTTPGLAIGHQVGRGYTDATAILTGTWGPDQAASATVHTVKQNDACYQEVELRLRSAISAHSNRGYEISYKLSRTSEAYLIIVRWNGPHGDFTYLVNEHGRRFGVKEGDVVSASVVGDLITAYKNGAKMGQARDRTFTAGSPGMGFNLANTPAGCAGTNGDYGFTSFTAHD